MMTLYVGNLPFTVTEDAVTNLVSTYSDVTSVKLIKDKETGRSKGFAFVEVADGEKVITSLNGSDFGGRKLVVNEARPKQDNPRYDSNRKPNYRSR